MVDDKPKEDSPMPNLSHVTLREYVERIFTERQAALELAFKAQQDALALAAHSVDQKLEKLNELRQEVVRDRGQYVTRDKHESDMQALYSKSDTFQLQTRQWQDRVDGALGIMRWLSAGGAAALAIEIARFIPAIPKL